MKEYTKILANYFTNLTYEDLSDQTVAKLKICLLDTMGCAMAGNDTPETKNLIMGLFEPQEKSGGAAKVFCSDMGTSIANAILVNSAMSHAVELDDLHKASKTHPGAVIMPAVLTAGAANHISGKQALAAMAAGYEMMIRLGEGVGNVSHRKRGWHATSTCGAFGAAASCGKILGLDEVQMANAFGLAGSQAAGTFAYLNDGSICKRFQVGRSAQSGWLSAKLAQAGLTGPVQILEAESNGWIKAVSDKWYLDRLTDDLGDNFLLEDTGLKYYACCGHIHQAADATIYLRNTYHITPDMVESIVVRTYEVSGVGWGIQGKPKNSVEGQFNIPYVVAVSLFDGAATLPQFKMSRLSAEDVNELAKCVRVEIDPEYTSRYPAEWCSSVEIILKDGRTLYKEACGAKGDPKNPLTDEELCEKFTTLSAEVLTKQEQQKAIDIIAHLEDLSDMEELMNIFVKK